MSDNHSPARICFTGRALQQIAGLLKLADIFVKCSLQIQQRTHF